MNTQQNTHQHLQQLYATADRVRSGFDRDEQRASAYFSDCVTFVNRSAGPASEMPNMALLDIGCGAGWSSFLFARMGYQVTGVDLSVAAFEQPPVHGLTLMEASALGFIDEAQDCCKSWFLCSKLALKEPDDGDLLIVGDGTQSLYRRRPFTWKEGGVNAPGRTINKRFDLDKNYRNTREILKVAAEFVSTNGEQNDPETRLQIIRPNPDIAVRSGPAPEMLTASTAQGELEVAVNKILAWREKGLKPSEIAVLYRANTERWVRHLASLLSQHMAVYWPHNTSERYVDPSGVCVRTMHSAKGLQWRAVLVMRCDMMPFLPDANVDRAEQELLERGLMYVAMTRAEEILAFTRSTLNGFACRIEQLLDHDVARAQ